MAREPRKWCPRTGTKSIYARFEVTGELRQDDSNPIVDDYVWRPTVVVVAM